MPFTNDDLCTKIGNLMITLWQLAKERDELAAKVQEKADAQPGSPVVER